MTDPLGRALDKLVAIERGYRVIHDGGHWLLVLPNNEAYMEAGSEDEAWRYVPQYSTSESDSLDVVLSLYEGAPELDLHLTYRPGYARLRADVRGVHIDVTANTLPLARCKAYLSFIRQTRYNRI